MTTSEIAKQWVATTQAVRARKITVEQAREQHAALIAQVGEDAYEAGKWQAMCAFSKS